MLVPQPTRRKVSRCESGASRRGRSFRHNGKSGASQRWNGRSTLVTFPVETANEAADVATLTPGETHGSFARAHHFRLRELMERVTIYHNPGCGKSRGALEILNERGVACDVVEYLKAPPDRSAPRAVR